MRRHPVNTYIWALISTLGSATSATIFAAIGLWWFVPVLFAIQGLAWYFAAGAAWFAAQSKVMRGDYS